MKPFIACVCNWNAHAEKREGDRRKNAKGSFRVLSDFRGNNQYLVRLFLIGDQPDSRVIDASRLQYRLTVSLRQLSPSEFSGIGKLCSSG